MNLGDFEKTNISGLYISKESHPEFGNKYIAIFQHDKKRYVKVLGYTNKDNLTRKDAIELFKEFKDSIVSKSEVKIASFQLLSNSFFFFFIPCKYENLFFKLVSKPLGVY